MLSQFWWQLMIGFRFILDELNPPSTMFCLIFLTNSVYLVFWQGGQEHWEETYDQLYYQRVDMSKDSKCIIIFFDLLLFFCFMSWAAADRMSSSPLSGDIRTFSSKLKFLDRFGLFAGFGRLNFLILSSFFRSLWISSEICFLVSTTSFENVDKMLAVFCGG